jgi:putative PIN family toxin of toxin-antitoxin system
MTTAVFDCVVLLQAAATPRGAAGACLEFVESGAVNLFLSPAILKEARDVFARPAIRKRFPKLTDDKVERYLLKVATLGTMVADVPSVMQVARDPKDEPYLNLAIARHASFLVTRDKDLLDLMNDDSFRAAYPKLAIVDPVVFLKHVRSASENEDTNE